MKKIAKLKHFIFRRTYTKKEVVALFQKFESDRSRFIAEDAADILPLERWLEENNLAE